MTVWQTMENRIRERGVRVDERLALLEAMRAHAEAGGDLQDLLAARHEALLDAVGSAARDLRDEVRT